MNISQKTLNYLNETFVGVLFYDKNFNQCDAKNATEMNLGWRKLENNEVEYCTTRSIKVPIKKEVTIDWIENKLNKDSDYQNLSKYFSKLLPKNYNCYPTSYGIGVNRIFTLGDPEKEIKDIENKLKNLGIKYYTEWSDAFWVFRFKISKNKETLKIINSL